MTNIDVTVMNKVVVKCPLYAYYMLLLGVEPAGDHGTTYWTTEGFRFVFKKYAEISECCLYPTGEHSSVL